VHRRLTQSLRFTVRYLQWIPQFLIAEKKRIRVDMVGELLRVLASQVTHQWHNIVALDESWVYLYTEHELIWVSPGETVPNRERQAIQSPRPMFTLV
jgi:hypothetical protein